MVRNDIAMDAGKAASQAGHAYLGAFLKSQEWASGLSPVDEGLAKKSRSGNPESVSSNLASCTNFNEQALAYSSEQPGTKVCLGATLAQIFQLRDKAVLLGVPHFLVVDSGCANFFNGEPTVTGLGLGPLYRHQSKPLVGKLRLFTLNNQTQTV